MFSTAVGQGKRKTYVTRALGCRRLYLHETRASSRSLRSGTSQNFAPSMVHLVSSQLFSLFRSTRHFAHCVSFSFCRMACAFCYYGVVLMTTEMFEASENRCSKTDTSFSHLNPVDTCSADCKELTTTDYIDLLWTTLAEFPGTLLLVLAKLLKLEAKLSKN